MRAGGLFSRRIISTDLRSVADDAVASEEMQGDLRVAADVEADGVAAHGEFEVGRVERVHRFLLSREVQRGEVERGADRDCGAGEDVEPERRLEDEAVD